MMGSKEEDVPTEPTVKPVFVEDMNEAELATAVSYDYYSSFSLSRLNIFRLCISCPTRSTNFHDFIPLLVTLHFTPSNFYCKFIPLKFEKY